MKSYRALIHITVEVLVRASERGHPTAGAQSRALRDHLQLACEGSEVAIVGVRLPEDSGEEGPGPAGRRRHDFRIGVVAEIGIGSKERAVAELRRVSSRFEEFARLALEGSGVRLKEVRIGDVRLKRYYE